MALQTDEEKQAPLSTVRYNRHKQLWSR